jgi:hypothetical protein
MTYDLTGRALYPLSDLLTKAEFPLAEFVPQDALDGLFGELYYTEAEAYSLPGGYHLNLRLVFEGELSLLPPGLPGIALVAGANDTNWTALDVEFLIGPEPLAFLRDVPLTVRLDRSMLKPMRSRTEVDESKPGVDVSLGTVSLAVNPEGFEVDVDISASLPLSMIADSGVLIEATNVRPILGPKDVLPPGLDDSFRGVFIESARIYLPEGLPDLVPTDMTITNCSIGTGGFSGGLALNYNPVFDTNTLTFSGPGSGTLFDMQFGVKSLGISFKQNSLEEGFIAGSMVLPYFDAPLDLTIGLSLDGGFTVALSSATGLITLTKPGLLILTLESIRFSLGQGVFSVALSGEIIPDVGGMDWPAFRVKELVIDSQGNVKLEGGWLELDEQYALSFYGFQLEISKLGFGSTDNGRRWIGFNGGLKLVEGLPAGASVEGMRIFWDPKATSIADSIAITLNGVGVELDIPDVLYLKGFVAMSRLDNNYRFSGNITVNLKSLGIESEAELVIGHDEALDINFFAIYLRMDLPAGIPLGLTGLAIYGMSGLFVLNMQPNRQPGEAWYAIQPAKSWFHRKPIGIDALDAKWGLQPGSMALGAGITLGTLSDNGLTFNGRFLLIVMLPGPVILLEGRSNILKERARLNDEPAFHSVAVIDGRQGTFLVGLDAQYRYDEVGSNLISIGGGTEAYFDFKKPDAWHLYLGIDEPRDRRIRANVFKGLFEANSYFMIDSSRLRTGMWVGYDKSWKFGPLRVSIQAWLEGKADLSFKPPYFTGSIWVHGSLRAKIFGHGFGLGADAWLAAGVFDPFHIKGQLYISLNLPWPLKDVSKTITLEWGPDSTPPPIPVPLKEVAIEHLKVTTSWPLPAPFLSPDLSSEDNGFLPSHYVIPDDSYFPDNAPVVPLDARPHITFGRVVHDKAGIGGASTVHLNQGGSEWIGDQQKGEGPAKLRYSLLEVALERQVEGGDQWEVIASKRNPESESIGEMFGSWAPVPELPSGNSVTSEDNPPLTNTKLWLWSLSPFDYTQRTGGEWEEWIHDHYPDYPCITIPEDKLVCCDFSNLEKGKAPPSPWFCPDHPQIVFAWCTPPAPLVKDVIMPYGETTRSLCFVSDGKALLHLGHAVKRISLSVAKGRPDRVVDEQGKCVDFTGWPEGRIANQFGQKGCIFEGFNDLGQSLPQMFVSSAATDQGSINGVTSWTSMEIRLPGPATVVELKVSTWVTPLAVDARDLDGNSIDSTATILQHGSFETLRLETPPDRQGICSLYLSAPRYDEIYLHGLCFWPSPTFTVFAQTFGASFEKLNTYSTQDNLIEIEDPRVRGVVVSSRGGGFCLTRVCVLEGLDDAERNEYERLQRTVLENLTHWETEGGTLLPSWSRCRLKIVTNIEVEPSPRSSFSPSEHRLTQYAYFRTEGPPGLVRLSLPDPQEYGQSDPAINSGLDDLTRYVRQTIPPTVPTGSVDKPLMPRPVYCAYDVGVQFNETYVEQMYAAIGRDLSLYLFDNNDRPARDADGRLLSPPNCWGRQPTLSLSRSEQNWFRHLDNTTCASVEHGLYEKIALDQNLHSTGQVLEGDTLYEARLVPLLLHETFSGYHLGATASTNIPLVGTPAGGWLVIDVGTPSGQWGVSEEGVPPSQYIRQLASVSKGRNSRNDAFPGGTFLLPGNHPYSLLAQEDQPGNWTDYRASAFTRSDGDNPVGLAVRWNQSKGYLFYMDRALNRRRLVRVDDNGATVLAEMAAGYISRLDSLISFEAIGDRLRVFVDGELNCEVLDSSYSSGSMALFACENPEASFREIKVDDLRASAPVVYRFKYITSRFADFEHHIHSFRGVIFTKSLSDINGIRKEIQDRGYQLVNLTDGAAIEAPVQAESDGYEFLATKAIGPSIHQAPDIFDVTRIDFDDSSHCFLIRTGEPIDWKRTTVSLTYAPEHADFSEGSVMMRSADCIGLILIPRDWGRGLSAPEYRLCWGFRRNNSQNDPGSLELSQAGDTTDEVAQIDIPWKGYPMS